MIKYLIAFSGGYDSTNFVKILCQTKLIHNFVLIMFYIETFPQYNKRHFFISQILYKWNIKFLLSHEHSKYGSTKQKNRMFLLKNIYNSAIEKKIYKIIFLQSHTDIVETFIMRTIKKSNLFGFSTILDKRKEIFYMGEKLTIIYPTINKTRGEVVKETRNMVYDYPSQNDNLTRNKIRQHININKYYHEIIEFITIAKLLDVISKYTYDYKTFTLITKLENKYHNGICEEENIRNVVIKGLNILNYTLKYTVRKNKINIKNLTNFKDCNLQIKDNYLYIKYNIMKYKIHKFKNKTIIIVNAIHKIIIFHPQNTEVNVKTYYNKSEYKLYKYFQKNFIFTISNKLGIIKLKSYELRKNECISSFNIHIFHTIIQGIIYK